MIILLAIFLSFWVGLVQGESQVRPVSVSQSSSLPPNPAKFAIDDDLTTSSHTICALRTDLWFKMKFDHVYCFSEIELINSKLNQYAARMDDTKVLVVNRVNKGTESLCGVIKVTNDRTIDGQTYRIPCDRKCGDEVKLTVRYDKGNGNEPLARACIHMYEIKAFVADICAELPDDTLKTSAVLPAEHGAAVVVGCGSGCYDLVGGKKITCQLRGKWSSEPKCRKCEPG